MTRGTLALLMLAAAAPALAQPAAPAADRPPLAPTREASVLYRVAAGGNPPQEVRITSLPGNLAMRIDMPDRTYMLMDQAAKHMSMVVPDEQMILDLPWQGGMQEQFTLNSRMRFTRRAADTVAGTRCTNWEVALDRSRGTMCITEDGVMLRSLSQDEQGRRNLIEAISVSYAPAPASDFTAPADYDHMAAAPNPGGRVR